MDNAPTIILFWFSFALIFLLMITLLFIFIVLNKRKNTLNAKKFSVVRKICLFISILCSLPLLAIAGYILYLYAS